MLSIFSFLWSWGSGTTVSPGASTARAQTVAPSFTLGSLTESPAAVTARAQTVAPSFVLGSFTTTALLATARAQTVAPSFVLGSLTESPAARTARAQTIALTAVLGNYTSSPAINTARAQTIAPTVTVGGLVSHPSPVTARAQTVAPSFVLGSFTTTALLATARAQEIAPALQFTSATVAPAVVTARATVVAPSLIIGGASSVIESGLFNLLASDSGVGAFVGNGTTARIYFNVLAKGAKFPALVFHATDGGPLVTLDSTLSLAERRFQFDSYAADYLTACKLSDAVLNLLQDFSGTLYDGTVVEGCIIGGDRDDPFEVGGTGYAFRTSLDVDIFYAELG